MIILRESSYCVPGNPVAQRRHQMANKKGYDSQIEQKRYWVLQAARLHMGIPYDGYLAVDIKFYFPIPKNSSRRNPLDGMPHINRPDIDNCEKWVLDCCRYAEIIHDDSRVFRTQCTKIYSTTPRTYFKIRQIDPKSISNLDIDTFQSL